MSRDFVNKKKKKKRLNPLMNAESVSMVHLGTRFRSQEGEGKKWGGGKIQNNVKIKNMTGNIKLKQDFNTNF